MAVRKMARGVRHGPPGRLARSVAAAALLLLCLAAGWSDAALAEMRLCTARQGSFPDAADLVVRSLVQSLPSVRVLETRDSMENIAGLAKGRCDSALVQKDALMIQMVEHAGERFRMAPPIHLYERYLHLICRRDRAVRGIGDLLDGSGRHTLLVAESASATTWHALMDLDPAYRSLRTRELSGAEALAALTGAPGPASCMILVIGLDSAFMSEIDRFGDTLRLVPFDLWDFGDAEQVENRVFMAGAIPAGTYRNLQARRAPAMIETVSVPALVITRRDWAERNAEAFAGFVKAVGEARRALREKAAP